MKRAPSQFIGADFIVNMTLPPSMNSSNERKPKKLCTSGMQRRIFKLEGMNPFPGFLPIGKIFKKIRFIGTVVSRVASVSFVLKIFNARLNSNWQKMQLSYLEI